MICEGITSEVLQSLCSFQHSTNSPEEHGVSPGSVAHKALKAVLGSGSARKELLRTYPHLTKVYGLTTRKKAEFRELDS